MTSTEDCASVLDAFIHDVANLPLEINHMMEEITAKDKEMQKYHQIIATKDGSIQKHVKANGSLVPHPKEDEYTQAILKHLDLCEELQNQKIALSDKACILLDRQVKRFDAKIKDLISEGLLSNDPPIPTIFNRKSQQPDSGRSFFANLLPAENTPLQITSGNAAHPTGRVSQTPIGLTARTAPGTPVSAAQQIQRHRESSAGANDPKRRRFNATISNMPAQSSSLRQSSLGPGTPKAGTPGSTRAGSAGPRSTTGANKKPGNTGKNTKISHQQVNKLKGKPVKRLSTPSSQSSSLKKRAGTARNSPSVMNDDDSVLSSADVSDADSHTTRSGRRSGKPSGTIVAVSSGPNASGSAPTDENTNSTDVKMHDANSDVDDDSDAASNDVDDEDEIEQEDTRQYCFCHKVSYGEMVGCENQDCPYEWFHLDCVGLKKAPSEKDTWYCSECEKKGFKSQIYGK